MNALGKSSTIAILCFTIALAASGEDHSRTEPLSVSLVSLIATPERYDGKYVRVLGVAYLDSKYSINAIYLTREDKSKANAANGIFLYLSSSGQKTDRLNNRFVVVQGVFRSDEKGHLHIFPGSLVDVDRLEAVVGKID